MEHKVVVDRETAFVGCEVVQGAEPVQFWGERGGTARAIWPDAHHISNVSVMHCPMRHSYEVTAEVWRTVVVHDLRDYGPKPLKDRAWYVRPRSEIFSA